MSDACAYARYAANLATSGKWQELALWVVLHMTAAYLSSSVRAFLNLPQEQRVKFTLAAVGPDMMRRLVADAKG